MPKSSKKAERWPLGTLFRECDQERRAANLPRVLEPALPHIRDAFILDFGCGDGLTTKRLLELGAEYVVGVEPDRRRLQGAAGTWFVATSFDPVLPFADETFDTVVAVAALEHIPQPRDAHIAELWRVLKSGGVLIIGETPNKYFPMDDHTTGLWFNHWLPSAWAHRRACSRGRFAEQRTDWVSSGWRGLGYYELKRAVPGRFQLIPESTRRRHRLLSLLGLPASLVDPYPTWMLRKVARRP